MTNLIFTFIGLRLIDRLGRRTLLYAGSFGYIASLGLASWAFFTAHHGIVPLCIFAFIAPLLTTFFPRMVSAFAPGYVFAFFAGMMVLQLIWVKTMMIETKGVSLERISERLDAA